MFEGVMAILMVLMIKVPEIVVLILVAKVVTLVVLFGNSSDSGYGGCGCLCWLVCQCYSGTVGGGDNGSCKNGGSGDGCNGCDLERKLY